MQLRRAGQPVHRTGPPMVRGRGGIGRRKGLKIPRQRHAGSSPAARTTSSAATVRAALRSATYVVQQTFALRGKSCLDFLLTGPLAVYFASHRNRVFGCACINREERLLGSFTYDVSRAESVRLKSLRPEKKKRAEPSLSDQADGSSATVSVCNIGVFSLIWKEKTQEMAARILVKMSIGNSFGNLA